VIQLLFLGVCARKILRICTLPWVKVPPERKCLIYFIYVHVLLSVKSAYLALCVFSKLIQDDLSPVMVSLAMK
jgi:hypothetical protein